MLNNISLPIKVNFTGAKTVTKNSQTITSGQPAVDTVCFTSQKEDNLLNRKAKELLISSKVQEFNTLRENNKDYKFEFPLTNLSSKQLGNINLSKVNLKKSNFCYTNLQNANFEEANLKGTWLNFANLTSANFKGANLEGTYFLGTDLKDTTLVGAKLNGASLFSDGLDEITEESKEYIDKNYIIKDMSAGMIELEARSTN